MKRWIEYDHGHYLLIGPGDIHVASVVPGGFGTYGVIMKLPGAKALRRRRGKGSPRFDSVEIAKGTAEARLTEWLASAGLEVSGE